MNIFILTAYYGQKPNLGILQDSVVYLTYICLDLLLTGTLPGACNIDGKDIEDECG